MVGCTAICDWAMNQFLGPNLRERLGRVYIWAGLGVNADAC